MLNIRNTSFNIRKHTRIFESCVFLCVNADTTCVIEVSFVYQISFKISVSSDTLPIFHVRREIGIEDLSAFLIGVLYPNDSF
jgi:hypothetical protein